MIAPPRHSAPHNMMIPVLNQIYDRRYPARFMINVTGPLAVAGIK